MDRRFFQDASWWHWAATLPLLVASLAGYWWAIVIALVLCSMMGAYYFVRLRQLRPFPVQVRIAYLGLLAIGTLPWMQWIHWMQLVGTATMVTIGYCPLIRLLSLTPLNRKELLTRSLIWRVLILEPCVGGLIDWSASQTDRLTGCSTPPATGSRMACSLGNPSSLAK